MATLQWASIPPFPHPIVSPVVGVLSNGCLVVFGGQSIIKDGSKKQRITATFIFNCTSETWLNVTDYTCPPRFVFGQTGLVMKDVLYMFSTDNDGISSISQSTGKDKNIAHQNNTNDKDKDNAHQHKSKNGNFVVWKCHILSSHCRGNGKSLNWIRLPPAQDQSTPPVLGWSALSAIPQEEDLPHKQTCSTDGCILMAGGYAEQGIVGTLQVYSSKTNEWWELTPLLKHAIPRESHSLVALSIGLVSVGGFDGKSRLGEIHQLPWADFATILSRFALQRRTLAGNAPRPGIHSQPVSKEVAHRNIFPAEEQHQEKESEQHEQHEKQKETDKEKALTVEARSSSSVSCRECVNLQRFLEEEVHRRGALEDKLQRSMKNVRTKAECEIARANAKTKELQEENEALQTKLKAAVTDSEALREELQVAQATMKERCEVRVCSSQTPTWVEDSLQEISKHAKHLEELLETRSEEVRLWQTKATLLEGDRQSWERTQEQNRAEAHYLQGKLNVAQEEIKKQRQINLHLKNAVDNANLGQASVRTLSETTLRVKGEMEKLVLELSFVQGKSEKMDRRLYEAEQNLLRAQASVEKAILSKKKCKSEAKEYMEKMAERARRFKQDAEHKAATVQELQKVIEQLRVDNQDLLEQQAALSVHSTSVNAQGQKPTAHTASHKKKRFAMTLRSKDGENREKENSHSHPHHPQKGSVKGKIRPQSAGALSSHHSHHASRATAGIRDTMLRSPLSILHHPVLHKLPAEI